VPSSSSYIDSNLLTFTALSFPVAFRTNIVGMFRYYGIKLTVITN
jgi:hypothetical protein